MKPVLIDRYGAPDEGARCADVPDVERVVDTNALRALAPPSLRPRSQAVRPPGPHAAAPLEPQAQRTLASGRADRARPAVTGMLGAHTAAVKR